MRLPEGHHGFDSQRGTDVNDLVICRLPLSDLFQQISVVRKKLRVGTQANDRHRLLEPAFKRELRILALLRSLKHDNIVPFLTSFTIETDPPVYNFLFSPADISLQEVLHNEEKDELVFFFATEYLLLRQLSGLASALESLHDFCSEDLNVTLIGCHYDIAPRNILVQREKLLLSDFGLSMLRPETSQSMYAEGQGDYLAPERESIQDGEFVKGKIGRASDVWSLGCIILVIHIYHLVSKHKARMVKNFRKQRKIIVLKGV